MNRFFGCNGLWKTDIKYLSAAEKNITGSDPNDFNGQAILNEELSKSVHRAPEPLGQFAPHLFKVLYYEFCGLCGEPYFRPSDTSHISNFLFRQSGFQHEVD